MFESDSEDSFDPEECGSWTSIAIKEKSCGYGKEEGVELDAREAREPHGKTRCAQPLKPATTTKWYNMVDEPSGGFASERPTKDELQKSGEEMLECTKAVGKNTFWRDDEKAAVCEGAGKQGHGWKCMKRSVKQTLKSQRSSPQSSAALMTRCHATKVWSRNNKCRLTKRTRLSRKQAPNKVRNVRYRLDIQQKKVDEEKHVLGVLPWRQKRNIATANVCAMPTDEVTASQG